MARVKENKATIAFKEAMKKREEALKKGHSKVEESAGVLEDFTYNDYRTDIKKLRPKMPHIYLHVEKYKAWVQEQIIKNPEIPEKALNPIGLNDMTVVVKGKEKMSPEWALIAYTAFKEFYDLQAKEMYYDRSSKYWKLLNNLANEGKFGAFLRKVRRFLGMK